MNSLILKIKTTIKNDGFNSIFIKLFRRFRGYYFKLIYKRPTNRGWYKLKNNYKGKTVYLIGNGPSLNKTPLFLLKNEYTMVFNRFSLMLDRLNWSPSFYSTTDDLVLENIIDEAIDLSEIAKYSFFPDISFRGKVFFKKFPKKDNILWVNQRPKLGFSTKLPDVFLGGTTIYEGIQILKYLGFSKIVLLGVDMNYKVHTTAKKINSGSDIVSTKNDDPNHFDPRYFGKGKKYHQPEKHVVDNIFNSLRFLRDYVLKCKDFEIVNASIESKLDYFTITNLENELGFSDVKKAKMFEELLKDKKGGSANSFPLINKKEVEDLIELQKFRIKLNEGLKLIPKLTSTYTVMGPFKDEVYFLKN